MFSKQRKQKQNHNLCLFFVFMDMYSTDIEYYIGGYKLYNCLILI